MRMSLIDISLLLIPVALGTIFIGHGFQKLFGAFGGGGIEQVTGMVTGLGLNPPQVWAYVLALTESIGGIFLLLGIIPRISAALIAIVMLVAIIKIHWANGFFLSNGGFEFPYLIVMSCLAIIISGGGKLSFFNKF